jgi:hypothetical protein
MATGEVSNAPSLLMLTTTRRLSEFERRPQGADDLQAHARAAITECH